MDVLNIYGRIMQTRSSLRNDNMPCKIEEGLYLGSYGAAINKSALQNLNIRHILTVSTSISPLYPNEFVYKIISIQDKPSVDITQHLEECFNFIDEAKKEGGGVLVHCFRGLSRSVSVVVAYIMKKHHMRYEEAMEYVRSKRPKAAPNSGFIQQLKDLENTLLCN